MKLVSQERVEQRTADAQFTVNFLQERISECTQIVDEPVPQIFGISPQERVSERSTQIVDVPVLQILEKLVSQNECNSGAPRPSQSRSWPSVNECKIARPSKLRTFLSVGKRPSQWWG